MGSVTVATLARGEVWTIRPTGERSDLWHLPATCVAEEPWLRQYSSAIWSLLDGLEVFLFIG